MTRLTIALIGAGSMGSAIGRMLGASGARVLTTLEGRSAASAARAREAGMEDAGLADLAASDFVLSIVPPAVAAETAERLAPALNKASSKAVYIDCNAVSPQTVATIARTVDATGAAFVDGGIIGAPSSPKFYFSGPHAARANVLGDAGLAVRLLDGPIGAASALKMSYAGITKGLTALGSAMSLAAMRNGAGDALLAELAESQPQLAAWLAGNVPRMPPKAYRWVAEMEEIAAFIGEDFVEHRIYEGAAGLYARLAHDKAATDALGRFFTERGG
ncbi:NAD(P)-dependent oxidoreductase [Caballeronia concitans]|uniref:NAD binding domain of 6-phosphogluconate dehydrogenase n=1 Tax=Caballeronia concitans TaxID=1777133 RepID=A0A658QUS5_9BURK|nr:NAD(P)-dependent oxidoreductase [Caballeronia concitans]KIG07634.1 Phosphogluconate dehydrogenase, NAD-binding protein [Burkholderia sp. MR1]SAL23706.1 NAD binding domain of 6-phosphogluconate dehydrogenase [Caballeronia concitans]